PGLILGAAAALGGAWIGTGLGTSLATVAEPSPRPALRGNGRRVTLVTAALVATLVSLAGWGQIVEPRVAYAATYSVQGDRVRVVVARADASDWISIFGPRHPIGLFDTTPKPGSYMTRLGLVSIPP